MFKKRKDCEMSERLILCVMAIGVARVTGDCGRPPRLNNGSPTDAFLAMSSFPSGTKVTYKCYSGYTFTSGSRRFSTCKPDSTWTTLRSTCEKISCGNPGEIQDGYYEASDVTFGSKATFYCDPGYQLVGKPYRLCTAFGWGGQVPTCDRTSWLVGHIGFVKLPVGMARSQRVTLSTVLILHLFTMGKFHRYPLEITGIMEWSQNIHVMLNMH
ncbi:complement decay-accelerating factor-like isoform X1 [Chiloscyllium plagiosum]|uniref:complement decay-accelerating factor-like isoform X1 n=1 Tax=Chiloscyllium plagiosum TaxID=36176 RepID=UPI001CB87292|nr:complement decay-accelerating factor-like isoform X1 [Chiloscyllium plagiosum]